jgi:hypothetical protein
MVRHNSYCTNQMPFAGEQSFVFADDQGAPTRADTARNAVRDLWKVDAVVLGVIVSSGASGFSIGPPY